MVLGGARKRMRVKKTDGHTLSRSGPLHPHNPDLDCIELTASAGEHHTCNGGFRVSAANG